MRSGAAHAVSVILAAAVLLVARLYLLPENGPPDYDTVANWQVAQEIASGNFNRLFHHRAPLFNLFYGSLALFTTKLKALIAVNACLNVLAVLLLGRLAQHYLRLNALLFGFLLLAVGLSTFLVHSSRYLTIESASLPVFALFLSSYVRRCRTNKARDWYGALFWLAAGISINYKLVLAIPILVVLELLNPKPFLQGRPLAVGLGILMLPVAVWSLAGVLVGLPAYRYLAAYAGVTRFNVPNAAMRTGKFQSDFSFYFQYLFRFESPLVWVGLVGYFLVFRPWLYVKKKAPELPDVLAVFCVAFLLGMSVLLKAPRGLVFIYGPLYVLGALVLHRLLQTRRLLLGSLLLSSACYTAFLCLQYIYQYSGNGYAQMAAEIKKRNLNAVVQTAGNGLVPFLPNLQGQVYPVSRPEELQAARRAGANWLVLDAYYLATNLTNFAPLQQLPSQAAVPEPGLVSPLFFLEHAEFTGLGYAQTMDRWQEAKTKQNQLFLLKLPEQEIVE